VDRLERAQLVRRVPHPTDRRTTLVEITDSGRHRVGAATEDLNVKVFAQLGLGASQVDELVRILTDLRRNAGDFS
jgi:DNA-binding MarR family transcriptional regulator